MNTSMRSGYSRSARRKSSSVDVVPALPLICFSHLKWNGVWQRPQHILTRIANAHPVYYVEEPRPDSSCETPQLDVFVDQGVTILTPVFPQAIAGTGGFSTSANRQVKDLLATYFSGEFDGTEVLAWYYTPMAYGALPDMLTAQVTVYDATDELSIFRGALQELRTRERLLMQHAELVFSSGPSLHEMRKYRHPRAFCFPSGVEADHFRYVTGPVPDDLAAIPSPIIGFYGSLDERIDFDLIAGLADAKPQWSIVMIGPVAKSQERELARRPNIHYLGKRSYQDLPRYLAGFDAAILPYAFNDATRFISPTKTLEYLAGGKPVVSTPIRDVVDLYGDVVEFAETPSEFIDAIERLWDETLVEQSFRKHLVTAVLAEHNWDVIASRMLHLVHDVVAGRSTLTTMVAGSILPSRSAHTSPLQRTAKH